MIFFVKIFFFGSIFPPIRAGWSPTSDILHCCFLLFFFVFFWVLHLVLVVVDVVVVVVVVAVVVVSRFSISGAMRR